jgi:hypothetical protein
MDGYAMNGISAGLESSGKVSYFNELTLDLDNEAYFPSEIYERTRDNPNLKTSHPCKVCNDSLDEYAGNLTGKIFSALRA